MIKKLVCILIVIATVFSITSCSCFRSETKYDYDLEDYITLPNLKDYKLSIELDAIQQAIDTYLMKYAQEYTLELGDRVNVELKVYEANFSSGKDGEFYLKGKEIEELRNNDLWLESLATPVNGKYQLSSTIENGIKGAKVGATLSKEYVGKNMLGTDFFNEKYHNTPLYVDIKVKNVQCELGDVASVSYTGYYLDDKGNILMENGKEKTFDSSDSSNFYLGTQMSIEEFEQGISGCDKDGKPVSLYNGGMIIDEVRDIYATFPKDYEQSAELAGKRVLFKVTLKKLYKPPVYDDKFAENYLGFKTTAEFEKNLKTEFTLTKIRAYLIDNCKITEYPKSEYKASLEEFENNAEAFKQEYGLTVEEYVKKEYDMTLDEYIKSNMRTEMIYYALCEQLKDSYNVVPTQEELDAELQSQIDSLKTYYMQNGMTEADASAKAQSDILSFGSSYIYENVMYDKVESVLPSIVTVTEVAKTYTSISEAQIK